jgi:hypothetical protein
VKLKCQFIGLNQLEAVGFGYLSTMQQGMGRNSHEIGAGGHLLIITKKN